MSRKLELSGKTFGRLFVVSEAGRSSNGSVLWNCICNCGNTVQVMSSSMKNSLISSCGCLYAETRKNCNKTHGKSKSREYNAWTAAKQRCYYIKHDYYSEYGGRGITMCDDWKNSFENFYRDMGDCPEGMSIERIDTNGHYEPKNCKWDSASNQIFNTRMRPNNKSGKSGVYWHKITMKWAAAIRSNGRSIHLGVFENLEDAVSARRVAELKYYGRIKD